MLRERVAEGRAAAAALAGERDAERATVRSLRASLAELQALLAPAAAPPAPAAPPSDVERKRARLAGALERAAPFLGAETPDVSIIVPARGGPALTLDCLQSIADAVEDGPTMQIIVVDDASPEEADRAALGELPFVTVLRGGGERATQFAKGRYLHFLDNETVVRAGWLRELVAAADADERIGAVGSKLLYADGALEEAGGIVWRDASVCAYGRGDDPDDPAYNYTRDVDYCSATSLLVRRALFDDAGSAIDLCFALRERGARVVYQPASVVVHRASGVADASPDANFAAKWRRALERHYEADSTPRVVAARRLQPAKTIVMIERYVPDPEQDSGSNRLVNVVKLLLQSGIGVIFLPDDFSRSEPYTTNLQKLGVEVLHRTERRPHVEGVLRERLARADYVWMSRVDLAAKYSPIVRDFPGVPIIFDTVDLQCVRGRRELESERQRALELETIRAADVALAVTDVELKLLEDEGIDNVCVVPNVHESFEPAFPYAERSGLLFVGGYQHAPNVDAALWLCRSIMPIVWRTHPHVELTLAGSNPPASVSDLATNRVHVAGDVADATPLFERARLFVSPLRYGAGLKGTIGQAFSLGLPAVTTPAGAAGFEVVDGSDALIAEDAAGFARAIVRAYDDPVLWGVLSACGTRIVKRFSPAATRLRLTTALDVAEQRRPFRARRA